MTELELLESINANVETILVIVICIFLWFVLRAFYRFIEGCIF